MIPARTSPTLPDGAEYDHLMYRFDLDASAVLEKHGAASATYGYALETPAGLLKVALKGNRVVCLFEEPARVTALDGWNDRQHVEAGGLWVLGYWGLPLSAALDDLDKTLRHLMGAR